MSKLAPERKILPDLPQRHYFYCPACYEHSKKTEPEESERWHQLQALHVVNTETVHTLTGTMDHPTIRASILCTRKMPEFTYICHSYVTDGRIAYCDDCTHDMKGQTVDLFDIEVYNAYEEHQKGWSDPEG